MGINPENFRNFEILAKNEGVVFSQCVTPPPPPSVTTSHLLILLILLYCLVSTLRSAIICLKGCRVIKRVTEVDNIYSVVVREERIDT